MASSDATTRRRHRHTPEEPRGAISFISPPARSPRSAPSRTARAADRADEPGRLHARRRRPGRPRREQDRTRPAGRYPLARAADLRLPPHPGDIEDAAGPQARVAALRSEFAADAAAALRSQLAPLDQAGIRHPGRHLHPSRLHPDVLSAAERDLRRCRVAGRLFLPLPRLQIRSGRTRLSAACRRPTICRCRRTISSATPRSGSAKIRAARLWDFGSIRQL